MSDNELKTAYQVMKATNADDALLDTVKDLYGREIKMLKELPQELLDKLRRGKLPSVPTLAADQLEENVMSTQPDAVKTVMRPELESVEKNSRFFDNISYRVSADKVEARKKLNETETVSLVGDVFDKSIGVNYKTTSGNSVWKSGVEYEPARNSLKLTTDYNISNQHYNAGVYLDKNNFGVNGSFRKNIKKNESVSLNMSVFKSDAAFKLEYQSGKSYDGKIAAGIYGSTKYKEVGVSFRLTAF